MFRKTAFGLVLITMVSFFLFNMSACDRQNKPSKAIEKVEKSEKTSEAPTTIASYEGIYQFGTTPEDGPSGKILVHKKDNTTYTFHLFVSRGAPSYNMGELVGTLVVKDNKATYKEVSEEFMDCMVNFVFGNNELTLSTVEGHADCGFGHAVYADNVYKRVNKNNPVHFLNMEGDSALMKNIITE